MKDIVCRKSFDQALGRLTEVFQRLQEAKLKLNPSKCCLFHQEVRYLRHIVPSNGTAPDPVKITAVVDWLKPCSLTEAHNFVFWCLYYHTSSGDSHKYVRLCSVWQKKTQSLSGAMKAMLPLRNQNMEWLSARYYPSLKRGPLSFWTWMPAI